MGCLGRRRRFRLRNNMHQQTCETPKKHEAFCNSASVDFYAKMDEYGTAQNHFVREMSKQQTRTYLVSLEEAQRWIIYGMFFIVALSVKLNSVDSTVIKGPLFTFFTSLLCAVFFSDVLLRGRIQWFRSGAEKFLLPFLLLCSVSTVFISITEFALPTLYVVLGYGVCFLAGSQLFRDLRSGQTLMAVMILLSTLLASIALAQFTNGEMFGINFRLEESKRVMATLGNSNFLGGFLSLTIPLALSQLMSGHLTTRRWLVGLTTAAMVAALFLTQARSSIVAAGVSSMLLVVILRTSRPMAIVAAGLIFVGIGAGVTLLAPSIGTRFSDLLSLEENVSVSRRLYFWKAGGEAVVSSPLIGHGLGSHELVIPRFRNSSYWMNGSEDVVPHAHNEFLETAVELGIPGVLLYAALIAFVLWKGSKALRSDSEWESSTAAGIFCALVAVLLDNLGNVSLRQPSVAMIAWILSGVLISPLLHPVGPTTIHLPIRGNRIFAAIPLVIWGVLMLYYGQDSLDKLESDSRLFRARTAERTGRASHAVEEYGEAVRRNPYNLVSRLDLSMALLKSKRSAEALGVVRELRDLAPFYPKASLVESLALYELGRMNDAKEAIARELEGRDHPDAFYVKSLISARLNDTSGVREALEQVLVQNLRARTQARLDVASKALFEMADSDEQVTRLHELLQKLVSVFPRNKALLEVHTLLEQRITGTSP